MATDQFDTEHTDRLVNAVTAFRRWRVLRAAMETGYVPTLRPSMFADYSAREACKDLRFVIVAAGFNVYPEESK